MSVIPSADGDDVLSPEAIAALRELAIDRGLAVASAAAPATAEIVRAVREHFDVKERDEVFDLQFGAISFQVKGVKRHLGQTLNSTGLTIWRAADRLGDYIASHAERFRQKAIIELGCGLGVCAILLDKLDVNATVVATDGDELTMELLQANLVHAHTSDRVSATRLWWGQHQAFVQQHPTLFDMVIAADVIYEAAQVEPLVQTVCAILRPKGEFLLSFAHRNVPVDRLLNCAERHGLRWHRVVEPGDTNVSVELYELRWPDA
jgi:predicted nicotinamide N-methyase